MVDYGAGPRAGQFLRDGAKALAVMSGRVDVAFEDIKKIAIPVMRHRIHTNFQAQAEGKTSDDIVRQLIEITPEKEAAKYTKPGR
jgi:MoxR-like ATPase